jgi:hypothetical protein
VAGLAGERGAGPERVAGALAALGVPAERVRQHEDPRAAVAAARAAAAPGDRVAVLGSFRTLEAALPVASAGPASET